MDGLSPENVAKLEETIAPFSAFSSIEFLDITDKELEPRLNYDKLDPLIASGIKKLYLKLNSFSQKRFSKMIMCRLLLASIFPQYDKMIMFDVDTLFVGDISESFFIPLDDHYFGMVREWKCEAYVEFPSFLKCRRQDGIDFGIDADKGITLEEAKIIHSYFYNCGFMSINLTLWRKDNLEKCFYEFMLLKDSGLVYPEQDTLIIIGHAKTLALPYKFNVFPGRPDIEKIQERCMLHFYGDKPWQFAHIHNTNMWKKWHEALIQTPFKDAYFNAPFLDHLFESLQNRDKEIKRRDERIIEEVQAVQARDKEIQNRDKEIQNRDKEIHALNKILSFSDKRHSFETLLPRLSSKLLIEFLLFKAKQKVKRLIKRV